MEYIKAFYICMCFFALSMIGLVSTKRPICVPCKDKFEIAICNSERTEICIKDREQLVELLKETEIEITNQAKQQHEAVTACACKTDEGKSTRSDVVFVDPVFVILMVVWILFCCLLLGVCQRQMICRNSTRNKTDHEVLHSKANGSRDDTEGLQQSLFKKNIDATLSIPKLEKLKKCMMSVGVLFLNDQGTGTVVRIGSNYIITAWHVIASIVCPPGNMDHNGLVTTSMNLETLKHKDIVYIVFSKNTRNHDPNCRYGLLPKICFLDKKLDVCILELDGGSRFLPEPINVYRDFNSMSRGTTNKFVHVIGQHPATSNVVVDPGCKIILHSDKKVQKAKKWIKKNKQEIKRRGPKDSDLHQSYDDVIETEQNLILDTYLDFGASGGAVVSFTPEGEVALVAILMRGLPSWFWRKPSEEYGFPSSILRMEVGCLITHILKSEEWTEAEKERIFGRFCSARSTDHTEIRMETDQPERDASRASRKDDSFNDCVMETDQLETDAIDTLLSKLPV